MTRMAIFTFNSFQENTYLLWNSDRDAVIIDPGMSDLEEQTMIERVRRAENLTIKRLILTHAHIDHVLGIPYVCKQYGCIPELEAREQVVYSAQAQVAQMYGLALDPLPVNVKFLDLSETWVMGDLELEMRFTPGHSPGSVSFINHKESYVIAGDALFEGSIGRTDLPGGDYETLLSSIQTQLFSLPENYRVYSGHGPSTTIGKEQSTNPFFNS